MNINDRIDALEEQLQRIAAMLTQSVEIGEARGDLHHRHLMSIHEQIDAALPVLEVVGQRVDAVCVLVDKLKVKVEADANLRGTTDRYILQLLMKHLGASRSGFIFLLEQEIAKAGELAPLLRKQFQPYIDGSREALFSDFPEQSVGLPSPANRPSWFRGVIEGGLTPASDDETSS
jgi:hypothetical protein